LCKASSVMKTHTLGTTVQHLVSRDLCTAAVNNRNDISCLVKRNRTLSKSDKWSSSTDKRTSVTLSVLDMNFMLDTVHCLRFILYDVLGVDRTSVVVPF
jgi:hypothetical protein